MNPIVGLVFTVICAIVAIVSTYRLIRRKKQKAHLREREEVDQETKEA